MTPSPQLPGMLLTGLAAAKWYQARLQQLYQRQYGKDAVFPYWALQIDFEHINRILPHQMERAARLLAPYFEQMEATTKAPYILANMTLHESLQYFPFQPQNFYSIEKILAEELQDFKGCIGILGTAFTMQHDYFPALLPNASIFKTPQSLIKAVDELRQTYFYRHDVAQAKRLVQMLSQQKVDKWLIACTELSVAFDAVAGDSPLNMVDLPNLQLEKLIQTRLASGSG